MIFLSRVRPYNNKARWQRSMYIRAVAACMALRKKKITLSEIKYQQNLPDEMKIFLAGNLKKIFGDEVRISPFENVDEPKENGLYFLDEATFRKLHAKLGKDPLPKEGLDIVSIFGINKGKTRCVLPVSESEAKTFDRRREQDVFVPPDLPIDMYGHEGDELLKKYAEEKDHDYLTGILNRRAFERKAQEFRMLHPGVPAVLMFFDMDNLHGLNRKHGQLVADKLLKKLAEGIQAGTRKTDIIGRRGGDEFLLLLTGIRATQSEIVLDRIRKKISKIQAENKDKLPPFGFSVGVSRTNFEDEENWDKLLFAEAEVALKNAKVGKNKTVLYELGMKGPKRSIRRSSR